MNPTRRIRRLAAMLAAALVAFGASPAFGSTHPGAPPDSGLAACAYPLSTHDVTAADYRQIRAQFASSRWPDLRIAGIDYADLAVQLLTARGTGLGLCLPGSLVQRTTRCGSPRCRCHTDPSYLHGPYPSWIDNASSPKPRTRGGYSEDTPIRA